MLGFQFLRLRKMVVIWNQLPPLAQVALALSATLGIYKSAKHLARKKIFISFAVEDKNSRDLFVGQSHNEKTPFKFADMSVKEPWDNAWKTQCRERIKACHGVIVLVTKNTFKAEGVHWEIKCAKEERLQIKAIYAQKDAKRCHLPKKLKGLHIDNWSWPSINKFVEKLNREEK